MASHGSSFQKVFLGASAEEPQADVSLIATQENAFVPTSGNASSGTLEISKPSGTAENDFMVLVCMTARSYYNTNSATVDWSSTGFTSRVDVGSRGHGRTQYFTKTAGASEGSSFDIDWTWNKSGKPKFAAYLITYRSMDFAGVNSGNVSGSGGVAPNTYAISEFTSTGHGLGLAAWCDQRPTAGTVTATNHTAIGSNQTGEFFSANCYKRNTLPLDLSGSNYGTPTFRISASADLGAYGFGSAVHIYRA